MSRNVHASYRPRWPASLLLVLGLLVGTLAQAQSGAVAFMAPVAEVVSNPYGLRSVWAQGDWVARATLLLLAFMSLLSWYFIIAKWLSQRQLQAQLQAANSAFTRDETLQLRSEAMDTQSPFRSMLMSALAARRRHASLAGQVDLGNWLSQDIVHSVSSLQMRSQEGLYPGHGGIDGSVCWFVRYGLGYLQRTGDDWCVGSGFDRQSRRPGR